MAGTFLPTGASDLAFVDRGMDRALRVQELEQDALNQEFARAMAEKQFAFTQDRAGRGDMESDRGFDFTADQAARDRAFREIAFSSERQDAERSFGLAEDRFGLDELSVGDALKSGEMNRRLAMSADERAAAEAKQMASMRGLQSALSEIDLENAQKDRPLNDQMRTEQLAASKQRVEGIMAALPPAEAAKRESALRLFTSRIAPVTTALKSIGPIATKIPSISTKIGQIQMGLAQIGEDVANGTLTTAQAANLAAKFESELALLADEVPELGELMDQSLLTRAQERKESVKDRTALGEVDQKFEKEKAELSAQLGLDSFELQNMLDNITKANTKKARKDGIEIDVYNDKEVAERLADLISQARKKAKERFK